MKSTSQQPGAGKRKRSARQLPRHVRENLAVELLTVYRLTLRRLGLRPAELTRAERRSKKLDKPPRVSGPLLRDTRGLGALLLDWSREPPYLKPSGKPRVLPIRGKGATFESLARLHLPQMALNRIVEMACRRAQVMKRPGGQIALLGTAFVKFSPTDDVLTLANLVRHVDQLCETILHNRLKGRSGKEKRLERRVISVIPAREFPGFMQEFRSPISTLMAQIDASLTHRQPATARGRKSGSAVSVGIFVSVEKDLVRAGADAMRIAHALSRKPSL